MSNITTTNIDGNFPIAGQDNSSQGFRDNFTNIKNNFITAAAEITDIQQKGIFKAALSGAALDNDFDGALVSNANTLGFRQRTFNFGTDNGAQTIDFENGNVHIITLDGSANFTFDNIPDNTNPPSEIVIKLIVTIANVAHTVTIPGSVNVTRVNVSELVTTVDHEITFQNTGTYELEFVTLSDPAPTIFLNSISLQDDVFGRAVAFTNTADFQSHVTTEGRVELAGIEADPASATVLSTGLTTTWFTTAGAETLSLPAGADGQIRTLICYGHGGNMVVTVSNAAWGGGGTLTFTAAGQSCILQYIGGAVAKWFVLGNNGVTISS